jgi:hypothetical protein
MRAIHTRGLLGLIMKPQRMSNTSILWALCIPYVPPRGYGSICPVCDRQVRVSLAICAARAVHAAVERGLVWWNSAPVGGDCH